MGTIRVFENANRMDSFDLVCPSCGTVINSPYAGRSNRLSKKCPDCNMRLEEYCAIAVSHGDAPAHTLRDYHKALRDYWERETHGDLMKDKFEKKAEEIGIYDYSSY